ncbi:MAG: hypothetical protein RSA17_04020 [Ruthenibacterium sp.]
MAEFTPITTQEQFDAAIGERIKRERETIAKKYEGFDDMKGKIADYENKIGLLNQSMIAEAKKHEGYDETLSGLKAQVKGYETGSIKMRIAHETGIPFELATKLCGETEDDIRKDAESLAKFVGKQSTPPAPLKSSEPAGADSKTAALRTLTEQLVNKGE